MEQAVNLGLAKSIGVSNFNEEQLERLYNHANIKPTVNQVEVWINMTCDIYDLGGLGTYSIYIQIIFILTDKPNIDPT